MQKRDLPLFFACSLILPSSRPAESLARSHRVVATARYCFSPVLTGAMLSIADTHNIQKRDTYAMPKDVAAGDMRRRRRLLRPVRGPRRVTHLGPPWPSLAPSLARERLRFFVLNACLFSFCSYICIWLETTCTLRQVMRTADYIRIATDDDSLNGKKRRYIYVVSNITGAGREVRDSLG